MFFVCLADITQKYTNTKQCGGEGGESGGGRENGKHIGMAAIAAAAAASSVLVS